jgi:hypothetical protein
MFDYLDGAVTEYYRSRPCNVDAVCKAETQALRYVRNPKLQCNSKFLCHAITSFDKVGNDLRDESG